MTSFDGCVAAPPGRFDLIERPYSIEDVLKLRGSIPIEHTLARRGALRLWELLNRDEPVRALGALSGNQAMQMVRAGLEAIYLSGWQVAADSNVAGAMLDLAGRSELEALFDAALGLELGHFRLLVASTDATLSNCHGSPNWPGGSFFQ